MRDILLAIAAAALLAGCSTTVSERIQYQQMKRATNPCATGAEYAYGYSCRGL